jgi:hypothetical protein
MRLKSVLYTLVEKRLGGFSHPHGTIKTAEEPKNALYSLLFRQEMLPHMVKNILLRTGLAEFCPLPSWPLDVFHKYAGT